jgi:hypothetical protein
MVTMAGPGCLSARAGTPPRRASIGRQLLLCHLAVFGASVRWAVGHGEVSGGGMDAGTMRRWGRWWEAQGTSTGASAAGGRAWGAARRSQTCCWPTTRSCASCSGCDPAAGRRRSRGALTRRGRPGSDRPSGGHLHESVVERTVSTGLEEGPATAVAPLEASKGALPV